MMFRTPPPELAMTLAEDHRHNLMASAGNQPTGGTGNRNGRSFLCIVAASLGRLAFAASKPRSLSFKPPQRWITLRSEPGVSELVVPGPKERANRPRSVGHYPLRPSIHRGRDRNGVHERVLGRAEALIGSSTAHGLADGDDCDTAGHVVVGTPKPAKFGGPYAG